MLVIWDNWTRARAELLRVAMATLPPGFRVLKMFIPSRESLRLARAVRRARRRARAERLHWLAWQAREVRTSEAPPALEA